ncbi:DUF5722 domain-containing protein [Parafilimonas sp.]|uniref:DUF5722 domain-containing protein n=1 Tax=Parafilimonas sp. TaxID=1969739 RepID=UPI0039E5F5CC
MFNLLFQKINITHCIILFFSLMQLNGFSQDVATLKNNNVISYIKARFPNKITDVIVDKNTVTVKGIISGASQNLYLCELRMFDEITISKKDFVSATLLKAQGSNFQIQLPRTASANNETYDRLYSRWIITAKNGANYQAQSYAHYAEDINEAALQYLPEEKPNGKKGLEGFFQESRESDLQDLGIQNITMNITLPQVISLEPTQYSYKFCNKTYYLNPNTIQKYDRQIKLCSDNNIYVTAVILIQQNIAQNIKSILVHPDANTGVQSMANITSQQGFDYYAALIGFLAERYSRTNKEYGRISNWIVHNEVDNGIYWANAGNAKMEYYTELYDRVLRTTYYTVRQYNPAAKVFISLTHAWATTVQPAYYAPQQMLALLTDMSSKQGDYEWGVAFHPYPEDLSNPSTWNDKGATMDLNTTKVITPKNIELIDEWMRMETHLYKGQKVRTLLFSEQGANSKSYSKEDMLAQAAVIAYMWKKCSRLPSLESFDYHAQCDNRNERFKFGLWTVKTGTIATPDQKKTSWYIYQKAGTSSEDSALVFALPIIGISNWAQAYNNLTGTIMPYTVTFNVTKAGVPLKGASVFFNGEMHKTINGEAVFYNVAALSKNRIYSVQADGKTVKQANVVITKPQTITVKL